MITSNDLISELKIRVQKHIQISKTFLMLSEKTLQSRISDKSWSVLECLQHLNLYGDFYIPEIEKKMNASSSKKETYFKSGLLGNKFAMDMLPKEQMKTMNTFKSKNPIHSNLEKEIVIPEFINQQEKFLELLSIASDKNLSKIKTSITIPLLKFRLGDTFRFVIYHNERHIVQAQNVLKNLN